MNAEAGRRVGPQGRRRNDLVRLNEPHARQAGGVEEEPQKRLAVAVDAADDFLLALLPSVFVKEFVEHFLHLHRHVGRGVHAFAHFGPVTVAGADDVADAVFMAVDGEFIRGGQPAALFPQLAQRLVVERTFTASCGASRHAGNGRPPATIWIEVRIARIDEVVPEGVEDFEQARFERLMVAV